jgi:hypothetical protein
MGGLHRPYRFKFDYMVPTQPPLLVDVVRGHHSGLRKRLRYMMAKARLIRYSIEPDGIFPRGPDYRPVALVGGTLAGPDHDPYRYVRALLSVGWDLVHEEQPERIRRLVES